MDVDGYACVTLSVLLAASFLLLESQYEVSVLPLRLVNLVVIIITTTTSEMFVLIDTIARKPPWEHILYMAARYVAYRYAVRLYLEASSAKDRIRRHQTGNILKRGCLSLLHQLITYLTTFLWMN